MDSAIDPRFVLDDGQFDRMWKASKKLEDPKGITIRFIASTGCRLEESSLVYLEHLDWTAGEYSIVRITTIKRSGRPPRQVHIYNDSEFARELRKWTKNAKPNEPLFPVARRTLQRAFEKILDPIKPDRASLVHILRHTRASQLIAKGANWNYVRQQLGWSSLEMAKRYVHADKDHIAKVLGKLV